MKKVAIIGGGVAGLTAAIYALRANAEVTLFEQFGLGGYTANLTEIQNYPSYTKIEGWELASNIAKQAKVLGLTDIVRSRAESLTLCSNGSFDIVTSKQTYNFDSVVVATGTARKKLGIEDAYVGKGVSYCATCDGNFYKNMDVAVVGQNGHAVSDALYLADLCKKVYLLVPAEKLVLNEKKQSELNGKNNVEIICNSTVTEFFGNEKLEGVRCTVDGIQREIKLSGVFISVGSSPATDFIHIDELKLTGGYITVDGTNQTSVKGLFAAGDVTDNKLKQIVTACGDGARAGTYATAYAAARLRK